MLRNGLALGALMAWSSAASAQSLIVWLDEAVPSVELQQKADRLTGGGQHLAQVDLAFPPMAISPEDTKRYDALRDVVADGHARWEDFDVELPIATRIEAALAHVDVIRDAGDLDELIDARVFQGTAASKAFDPREFLEDERAAPFRTDYPGGKVNRPWLDAMALAPDREFTKADLGDGPVYTELQHYQELIGALSSGTLDLSTIPPGAQVLVDGDVLDDGVEQLQVRPGVHYLHLLRNDVVSGRLRIEVPPGRTVPVPLDVDAVALEQARVRVIEGSTTGFAPELKASLDALMEQYSGAVFVAAVDHARNDRVVVVPYARDAKIIPPRVVTLVVAGEIGAGVLTSSLFKNHVGEAINAPGIDAGFQLELGVYNAVVLAGSDFIITPGQTTSHAAPGGTSNIHTPVLFAPYGGLGGYVWRPNGEHVTLLFAGTYGWEYPAHMTLGGRASFGLPLDDESWFRVDLGMKGAGAPMASWRTWLGDQEAPLSVKFLRLGFASRF